MPQLEHIEAIERRLWGAADTLRANSPYASNEYFLPVMGLVFLRYAYSRYLSVKDDIEACLPTRGGKKKPLTKEDFSQKNAIYLRPNAQFDHLVALPDSEDRIKAVIAAMESIETDYESLKGALPKSEYQELDNDVLGQLLRTLNPDELKQVSGDVFGRIYEYFLTQFADEKAHDDGEFFTPVSLVSLIAIRSNFFYTRTVPCELWFLNRAKPETHRDKVLMIDARNIYRQVTRKIYDFSPEQQQNILAIMHLYRGETERFCALISNYLQRILAESHACFEINDGEIIHPLPDFVNALTRLHDLSAPFLKILLKNGQPAKTLAEYDKARTAFPEAIEQFRTAITETAPNTSTDLNKQVAEFAPLIEISRDLSERTDSLYKLAIRITDICETAGKINNRSDITRARRTADETRQIAIERLKQVNYFYQQARWLTERFPEAELCDVEGLVKLVDRAEIEANDWSLTPGRYVGVAPEEEDENFDFAETLREIHEEIDELNGEAVSLAATIKKNFKELGI